ncbi:MAG: efflux RND transporter permease subunit [Micrococcales bacterium]|nr:efflux RND transporter permease subunit [Micrococcales bacterium]
MHLLSVFSLRNRALIALLTIVVAVFGGIALTTLKQELIPTLTLPQLVISTSYPGASPEVVENDVSTPIERAIQGVEGLDSSDATSTSGQSSVSASFTYGTDIVSAEQKVQLAVENIQDSLPDGVTPDVVTGSIADLPVIVLAVTSDQDAAALSAQLNTSTVTELEKLAGVRAAQVLGDSGQRVTITPDTAKLQADGLTNQSIRDALKNNGSLLASGTITENGRTLIVQSGTRLGSTDAVGSLPLLGGRLTPDRFGQLPAPPTIGDVATVRLEPNPVTGYSRVNGEPSLSISITKKPAGNTVEVSKEVRAKISSIEDALGSGTKVTVVFDQAPFIQSSIESLATEGLLGLGFAVVVILVFLLSVRSTLVTAISIPVSVLITFVAMLGAGYTLNLITLGALTIAIGRVVDDSIVVIENIKRHLALGEEKLEAIKTGVREVATAVTASTITTVAVFLPLALVSDVTGELFRPFALTVTIALVASLFVALTIVPVLAYWFLPARARRHAGGAAEQGPDGVGRDELDAPTRLQRGYLPILRGTLAHPFVTLIVALLILGGSGYAATFLPTNFLGSSGQNTITVTQTLPAGTSLDETNAASKKVERAIRGVAGVDTVSTTLGSGGGSFLAAFGGGGVRFSITTDPDADQQRISDDVRAATRDLAGVGDVAIGGNNGGFASSDVAIDVTAPTAAKLATATDRLVSAVKDLPEVAQTQDDLSATLPYLAVEVDRAKAAQAGLSEAAVGGILANSTLPVPSGTLILNDNSVNIYIADPSAPTSEQALKDFQIPTARGPVALSTLATVEQRKGPASIATIRGVRSSTVTITPKTENLSATTAAVTAALTTTALPGGVTAKLGGASSDQSDAFGQLGLALLAAILIVYTVMVATFRSLRQPILLLVSVPFAATGAILLQLASGIPLGVSSLIGVLMLIGIVVTNAIVLIDLVNQFRARGMGTREAVLHGAARRLRPIVMTALATIFALTPMALGITGTGGFISQPLALVVIGGLVSSTVLTLVVLPTLYWLVEGSKERRAARRAARVERAAASASAAASA